MFRANPFYKKTPECLVVLFDLQCPGAGERLQREQAGRHGSASVEELVEGRSLIIRPAGATRMAS
jgi:hypothetical protein